MNIAYNLPTTHAVGFCCTEIGGDWKWMKDIWRFDSSWLSHELCHLCDARKMTYAKFDVSVWHSTAKFIVKLPNPICPLALLLGFDVTTIRWCQLHNVNLGLCWTANGSSLLYLIQLGYFGDPQAELPSLLDIAYLDFKEFTRAGGWRHSQRKFTPKLIIKKGSGAYMTTKGWNSRVITAWLAQSSLMAFNGTIECLGHACKYSLYFFWRLSFECKVFWGCIYTSYVQMRNGRHFGQWRSDQRFPQYSSPMLTAQTMAMNLGYINVVCTHVDVLYEHELNSGFPWRNILKNLRGVPVTCGLVQILVWVWFLCCCLKCCNSWNHIILNLIILFFDQGLKLLLWSFMILEWSSYATIVCAQCCPKRMVRNGGFSSQKRMYQGCVIVECWFALWYWILRD